LLCHENKRCVSLKSVITGDESLKLKDIKVDKSVNKACNKIMDSDKDIKDKEKDCLDNPKCTLDSGKNCPFGLPPSPQIDPRTGNKVDIESSREPVKVWKSIYGKYDDQYRTLNRDLKDKVVSADLNSQIIYSIVAENQHKGVQ